MRVDLPAPFSPTSAWIEPGATLKDTSVSAFTPAKCLLTPETSRTGAAAEGPSAGGEDGGTAGSFGVGGRVPSAGGDAGTRPRGRTEDRKSTRLNSSHVAISYAVF